MKKTKKIVALGIIAAMTMGILAGCGSKNSGNTGNASNDTATSDVKYPTKPVQVIIPANPGGDTDTYARVIAKGLEKALGKPVVITNVAGAGGSLGTKQVMDADPDGHTVLFFHPSMIMNKIFGVTDYDFEAFEMGPLVTQEPGNVILASKNSPYKTLKDLVEAAKANPGKINYAVENGGLQQMMCVALEQAAGIEFNKADVGSQSEKNAALLGGQVEVSPGIVGNIQSYIKSGDMIPLGIFAGERQEAYKDIPTLKEQGYDVDLTKPFFFLLPKGTPQEIVDAFTEGVKTASEDPEVADGFAKFFVKPDFRTPAETKALLEKQRETYQKLYDSINK